MQPQNKQPLGGAIAAEGIGSAVLVLVGAGAICASRQGETLANLAVVALVSGLTLCAVTFAFGRVSGAHLNPAVAFAGLLAGRLSPRVAARFIVAQLVGAAVAGVALRFLFPAALRTVHLGAPTVAEGVSYEQAVACEATTAFAWVLALAVTSWRTEAGPKASPHETAPIALGLVYAGAILVFGSFTGGAGNPARAFGPAFASGTYTYHIVYWVGPTVGALLAAAAYLAFLRPRAQAAEGPEVDRSLAVSHYKDAVDLYHTGRLEEAAHAFALATEGNPEWPEPYYYIGIIYRDFGDETNANAFFDAALHFRNKSRQQPKRKGLWR